jgi:hypothetical protein
MMTIAQIKSTLYDGAVSAGLLAISLVDIDVWLRMVAAIIGAIVGVLTLINNIQRMRINALDRKLKKLDVKMKEENIRRYFETKYSDK